MIITNFVIVITAVTAGILAVKKILGSRITPRGHMVMWLLVGILTVAVPLSDLLPVLPETDWSLRRYLPQVTETKSYKTDVPPYIDDGIPYKEITMKEYTVSVPSMDGRQPLEKTFLATEERAAQRDWAAGFSWTAGTGAAAGLFLLAAWRQRRKLKALPDCTDADMLHVFHEVSADLGLPRKISLKTGADATMLAGLRTPAVYMAAGSTFTEEELRHVFAHELTHYKHRDLWLNIIAAGFLCAFWWNPVFWLAVRRFYLDMEVYCDYDAARLTGDRQGYARMLVKAASGKKHRLMTAASLVEEEHQVSRRVKTLAKFKKPKVWASVLGAGVLLGVCVGLAVSPEEVQPQITSQDTEFLSLHLMDSAGEPVVLYLDEEKDAFLAAVNGQWREANVWRDVDINRGDGRAAVAAYLETMAEPIASFQFQSFSQMVSSRYPATQGSSVKLYSWGDFSQGMMVLELNGETGYLSDSQELWNRLVEIIGGMTVMRDTTYRSSSKEVNWIDEDGMLHQRNFSREGSAEALEDYLLNLPGGAGTKLSSQEITEYMTENRFDYWVDLRPDQGGYKIIGHLAEDADGEGRTAVIGVEVGSGYIYDDPELAALLAATILK